jgi:epoxide hydrolase-like predicted phosphatase
MIKNIIFDIGNVLISYKPLDYLHRIFEDEEIIQALLTEIFGSKQWVELDKGTITEAEAINEWCLAHPENTDSIRKAMATWNDMLIPVEGTLEVLLSLKDKGYKIYALSNYHKGAFEYIYNSNNVFSNFDGLVISCRINLIKPYPEIYQHLLKKHQLKSEECLFIDDMPENIKTAENLGLSTHLFKDSQNLYEYLVKNEILIANEAAVKKD